MLMSDAISQQLEDIIKDLPWQVEPDSIAALSAGLTQQCFVVRAALVAQSDTQPIFQRIVIKLFSANQTIPGLALWHAAANAGLAAKVIHVSDIHGFVASSFINAANLNQLNMSYRDKIQLMCKALANLHQLPCDLKVFCPTSIIADLAKAAGPKLKANNIQLADVNTLISEALDSLFIDTSRYVSCHGDLNFNNVLHGAGVHFVDFDCAVLAEPEWDIAMMLAINNLGQEYINCAISSYQHNISSFSTKLSSDKVTRYYDIALLINMLWFVSADVGHFDKAQHSWAETQIKHGKTLIERRFLR